MIVLSASAGMQHGSSPMQPCCSAGMQTNVHTMRLWCSYVVGLQCRKAEWLCRLLHQELAGERGGRD